MRVKMQHERFAVGHTRRRRIVWPQWSAVAAIMTCSGRQTDGRTNWPGHTTRPLHRDDDDKDWAGGVMNRFVPNSAQYISAVPPLSANNDTVVLQPQCNAHLAFSLHRQLFTTIKKRSDFYRKKSVFSPAACMA